MAFPGFITTGVPVSFLLPLGVLILVVLCHFSLSTAAVSSSSKAAPTKVEGRASRSRSADVKNTAARDTQQQPQPSWLVHRPDKFVTTGANTKVTGDTLQLDLNLEAFIKIADNETNFVASKSSSPTDGTNFVASKSSPPTDGETIDALEQYFWGMSAGVSLELGALDGRSQSMTLPLATYLGWTRILIEGNPSYRRGLLEFSKDAFSANVVICSQPTEVHYVNHIYTGGITEFMSTSFLRKYHKPLYNALQDKQNPRSIDWSKIDPSFTSTIMPLPCLPLSTILKVANVAYINYIILDVEGGEFDVLKTINWSVTKFDVLCIETEKIHRPPHYAANITSFLGERGYRPHPPQQMGRNTWYIRNDFVPSRRNGTTPSCFNGVQRNYRDAIPCGGAASNGAKRAKSGTGTKSARKSASKPAAGTSRREQGGKHPPPA